MSRELLIQQMYDLHTQMTNANGFKINAWSTVETWENGSVILGAIPQYNIKFGQETNNDETNSYGNNEYKNEMPVYIRFGGTIVSPSDELGVVGKQLEIEKSKMLYDIKRAFGNQYKIDLPGWYCGVEYVGEMNMEDEIVDLDPYSVVAGLEFSITYIEGRGINEW